MKNITFKQVSKKIEFLNPLKGFQNDVQIIEHRCDPLTDHMSIVAQELIDKQKVLYGELDQELLKTLVQSSKENCFMCPEKVTSTTPMYPSEILPNGRITIGEATLFPNLYPLSEFHAVCTLSHKHFLKLNEFSPSILFNGIQTCVEFINSVFNMDQSINYMTINSNYLFPAGASIIHPHFQVLGGSIPYTFLNEFFTKSQAYYELNGTNYWKDLIKKEKSLGVRFIGSTGDIDWITSFSPLGTNEIQGILKEKSHFLQLDKIDIMGLAKGLSNILLFYQESGYSTFNLAFYSGPLNDPVKWFSSNIRIITRANVYNNYRTDDYFLQKLLGNEVVITPPEILATRVQNYFQNQVGID